MRRSHTLVFGVVALGFFVLSIATVLAKADFDFVVADGRGYYVYLPSLIVDGDLDFRNQVLEHRGEDPWLLEQRTATGLIANRYTVGVALTLLPAFLVAHVAALASHALIDVPALAPNGYSLPYQIMALLTVLALGAATMALIDRLLTRFLGVSAEASMAGVLLFWIGSPYAYYYFREPLMAHVISTFWVTACVYLTARLWLAREAQTSPLLGPLLAFCVVMAVVSRPTNVFLALLVPLAWSGLRRLEHRRLSVSIGYAAATIPLLAQLAVWKVLFGEWIVYSYGGEGFEWGKPALFETLLSPRHGLFIWSPLLLFSFFGLWVGRDRWSSAQRRFIAALIGAFVLLWYLNSSWVTWWFGDAFGARAFLEMAVLFIVGLALWVEHVQRAAGSMRRVGVGLLGASVAYSWVLMLGYVAHWISRGGPLF